MSDALPISGLLATSARSGGTGLTGAPLPLGTVNLESLPNTLQSLNRSVTLSGVLSTLSGDGQGAARASDGSNLFRLSTSSGEILLRTPMNLRPGQGFLLQIPAGNPPQGAVLLTTNNTIGAAGPSTTGAAPVTPTPGTPTPGILPGGPPAASAPAAGGVSVATPAGLPALTVGLTTTAQILPPIPTTTPGAPGTVPAPAAPQAGPQASVPSGAAAAAQANPGGNAAPSLSTNLPTGAAVPPTASPLANVPNNMASTILASMLSGANAESASARQGAAEARPTANAPTTGNFGGGSAAASTGAGQASASLAATANAGSQPFGQANNLGDIRILGIARPGQALPPIPTGAPAASGGGASNAPATPPTVITATVVQSSLDGPTLIRFGEQMMLLQARGELPPGTRLQIALPTALASAFGDTPDPLLSGGRWQALQEASRFLQTVNPTAAQAMNASIPQIGSANLGTSMVFFMAALRLGDMRAWLGESTTRSLERFGNRELLDRLGSDFSRLAQQADDVLPGNWRPISIPMAHQGEIGLLHFYVKPVNDEEERQAPQQEGEADGAPSETRFLIDMEMSQLGRMQIDGLAHPGRVDVILRSMTTFPTDMRQELQSLFRDILESRGLEGGISFRHHGDGWIKLARQNWQQPPSTTNAPPPLTA